MASEASSELLGHCAIGEIRGKRFEPVARSRRTFLRIVAAVGAEPFALQVGFDGWQRV